jgi:hypothetical protein
MKLNPSITATLCIFLCGQALAQAQDLDKELSDLAENLATQVKEHGNKKVTVVDFTDLQGAATELGRYIAEQLTVNLVLSKKGFSVLDRANLNKILAEHKLTAAGLVDPENAKKLGMFAGVDALILGTLTPRAQDIALTAKIITTETAEIVGAAKANFKSDKTVAELLSHPAAEIITAVKAGTLDDEKPKVVKTFGDLRIEIKSLRIVNAREYLLTMVLTNQNPTKAICTAIKDDSMSNRIIDAGGFEFSTDRASVTGVSIASSGSPVSYGYQVNSFSPATQIGPHDSTTATLKFISLRGKPAQPGACRLLLEFLLGRDYNNNAASNGTSHSLVIRVEAN